MPAEGVFVEDGPEEAEAEGQGGEQEGGDASAERGASGVFVVEGAERNAAVAHAGGGVGEGEKEELVEQAHDQEDGAGAGEGDAAGGEVGSGEGEDRHEEEKRSGDQAEVDERGHGAVFKRSDVEGGLLDGGERGALLTGGCFVVELNREPLRPGGDGGAGASGSGVACGSGWLGDADGGAFPRREWFRGGGVRSVVQERAFGTAGAGFAGSHQFSGSFDDAAREGVSGLDGGFFEGVENLGRRSGMGFDEGLDRGHGRRGQGVGADRIAKEILLDGLGAGFARLRRVFAGGRRGSGGFDDGVDRRGSGRGEHFAIGGKACVAFGHLGGNGGGGEGVFHAGESGLVLLGAAAAR